MQIKQFTLVTCLLLSTLSACAENTTASISATPMKIQVSGNGRVLETPDMAYLNFTFSDRGTDAEPVRSKIDNQVASLLKLCADLDIGTDRKSVV